VKVTGLLKNRKYDFHILIHFTSTYFYNSGGVKSELYGRNKRTFKPVLCWNSVYITELILQRTVFLLKIPVSHCLCHLGPKLTSSSFQFHPKVESTTSDVPCYCVSDVTLMVLFLCASCQLLALDTSLRRRMCPKRLPVVCSCADTVCCLH
jgi:hypothetical protein